MKIFKFTLFFLILFFGFFVMHSAYAVTISIVPNSLNISEQRTFDIRIVLDSEDESINAIGSSINYSTSSLELIGVDRDDSVVDVWMHPPSVSSSEGIIEFLGGITNGVGGSSLNILNIRFKALQEGASNVYFSRSSVAAADGQGTRVLSRTEDFSVIITPEDTDLLRQTGFQPVPEIEGEIIPQEIEDEIMPQEIEEDINEVPEEVVVQEDVPEIPQVSIPLYPNRSEWYNYIGPFNIFYGVPEDVDGVAVVVNNDPNFIPTERTSSSCCGSRFSELEEGVWYVNVRFENEHGWGETYHHRIGIDVTPPIHFDIDISNIRGKNTQPIIDFETEDAISGIKEYKVYIDDEDPIISNSGPLKLPPQSVGEHVVVVRAYDLAGNFTQDTLEFEVSASEGFDIFGSSTFVYLFVILIFGISSWFIFRIYNSS